MKLIKDIDEILNKYGFKKVCEGSDLEERIDQYIEDHDSHKNKIGKRKFVSDILYAIASGDLSEKIIIEDFEKFAEKIEKKGKWAIEDEWLLKNLYINHNFYEKCYTAEIKDTLRTLSEMDLDSLEINSFIENKLSDEKAKEFRMKKIFGKEEAKKFIRPYIIERWAELEELVNKTGKVKKMEKELRIVVKELCNVKLMESRTAKIKKLKDS